MARPPITPKSDNVFHHLGIREPDVELAKADLATRIHRVAEHRRLTLDEAASLLAVPSSELRELFQGRLATCSLDQLLRMLTWLGDDIEIFIRPRILQKKRGALRVVQAAAVENPDDFAPIRDPRSKELRMNPRPARTRPPTANTSTRVDAEQSTISDDRKLLDRHAVEKMTCLDITTIYRKMSAGTFPQPVKIGRRRVAWRTSDITRWQQNLEVGTETFRWRAARARSKEPNSPMPRRRDRQ